MHRRDLLSGATGLGAMAALGALSPSRGADDAAAAKPIPPIPGPDPDPTTPSFKASKATGI